MHTLQAAITGVVQGLSEFLPVSSSAHIVFSNYLYNLFAGIKIENIANEEEIFFDILVHFGSLFAVLIYFFKDIKTIILDFFGSIKQKKYQNENFKLVNYIALSTIITGIIGILLKSRVEILVSSPKIVCIFLFVTGLILLTSEKLYKGDKKINLKTVILIAIAQGFAIIPGFSRSGLTISTALFRGLDRINAAKFSFLMSIPVILLASLVYPLLELDLSQFLNFNLKALITGFFASFISGYLCIKYFMKLLEKISLRCFGIYCILASIVLILLFQFCYHI